LRGIEPEPLRQPQVKSEEQTISWKSVSRLLPLQERLQVTSLFFRR